MTAPGYLLLFFCFVFFVERNETEFLFFSSETRSLFQDELKNKRWKAEGEALEK